METVQYQFEEKMGGGSWSRVYQTKEEADYETPRYVSFVSEADARAFAADGGGGRWSKDGIKRGVVRLLCVRTTVTPVE